MVVRSCSCRSGRTDDAKDGTAKVLTCEVIVRSLRNKLILRICQGPSRTGRLASGSLQDPSTLHSLNIHSISIPSEQHTQLTPLSESFGTRMLKLPPHPRQGDVGRTSMPVVQKQREMLIPHLLALCSRFDRFLRILCDNQAIKNG